MKVRNDFPRTQTSVVFTLYVHYTSIYYVDPSI